MKNLLNGTDIATVFLDRDLNIKRFTDQARAVIRLIPSDIGRPIGDLVSKLHYDQLADDARKVLRTLFFKEAEVRGEGDHWYLMRMLPYRTTENVIDGLVITFVDITKVKGLQENERRLYDVMAQSPTTVCGQDRDLRITWAYSPVYGRDPRNALGRSDADLLPADEAAQVSAIKRRVLEDGTPEQQMIMLTVDDRATPHHLHVAPLRDQGDAVIGVTCIATDVSTANGSTAIREGGLS